MFVKTKLSQNSTKPNRRKKRKKEILENLKPLNGSKGTGTDGQLPRYGARRGAAAKSKIKLPAITPWKVILASFLIGICGLFYISHMFSTHQTLQEVQQLEAEYNRIKRIHDERRLEFDRMVGPKEIYQQAREQGFINAGPADQILILK